MTATPEQERPTEPADPGDLPDTEDEFTAWQLIGLPGALSAASYLTSKHAPLYRLIVDVLLDAQRTSLQGVAHDDLMHLLRDRLAHHLSDRVTAGPTAHDLLQDPTFSLEARMKQLEAWGVVTSWEDRIRSDEDFQRHLARYQLEELGARLHRAIRSLDEDGIASTAATLAPPILAENLAIMRRNLGIDPTAVFTAWAVVQPTLEGMARAAAGWQAQLAGVLSGTPNADKLSALQETLRRYVDMWGSGVDTHSAEIANDARSLLDASPARWRVVALHASGSETDDNRLDELAEEYASTLHTVLAWFDGPDSQARRLRRQMRDTIAPLIRGQRTLAAVGGHVSRRNELLALAERLEDAASDADAWTIWCTHTGLYSARHLPLTAPAPGQNPAGVSFWDAEPTPVEARLRRHGSRALTGRPARMADRSKGKAAARARAAAEQAAQAKTRAAVLARTGLHLAQWHDVTADEAELLINFIARIATTDPHNGIRRATTGDGLWNLVAEPAPWDDLTAVIHTPSGRIVFDNVRLHITGTGPEGSHGTTPRSARAGDRDPGRIPRSSTGAGPILDAPTGSAL